MKNKIDLKKYKIIIISVGILFFTILVYIFSNIIFDAGGIYPTLTNIIIVWSSFILLFICLYKIIKKKEIINIISIYKIERNRLKSVLTGSYIFL